MATLVLVISLIALTIALGEYVCYNFIIMVAGLRRLPQLDGDVTPPITVVIPVHNEERHIRKKLENVLGSDYPPELLDIIVVDDGSSDRTVEEVRSFESKGVRLLRMSERRGKIFAQKEAFAEVKTDIVVITDATILAPPDAFRRLAAHMSDPRVGAVSASIEVRNSDVNYLTRISQFLFDIQNAQKFGESRLDSAAGLFGQLSLIRRNAVGDFSTDAIYEDREFGIALRKNGYRARLERDVAAGYVAAESLVDFSKQKQRNIAAMTQSIVRHAGLLFNPRYGWYGLLIFPEYSLFRMLRVYLIAASFILALAYGILFNLSVLIPLLIRMICAVLFSYLVGTALLAPLVKKPWRFLYYLFISIPAMILVTGYLGLGSLRYFRGDFSAKWERVKRDRTV